MKGINGILISLSLSTAAGALDMQNVAHRGLHYDFPENTVEAIKAAYDSGATWVETDFHSTKSGLVVCIHCERVLKELSGVEKKISELTADDLQKIDLGKSGKFDRPYRIPLMADVLKLVPKRGVLQAEIKGYSATYAEDFRNGVRSAGLSPSNILVSSFDMKAIKDFKAKCPEFDTMWLVPASKYDLDSLISQAKKLGVKYIAVGGRGFKGLDTSFADGIRAAGFEFRVWGVNDFDSLKKAAELGATGFTTNRYTEMFKLAEPLKGVKILR